MLVSDIVKQVRLCIDEEGLVDDYSSQSMNNIIKGKMADALRWCCMYGEGSLLGGTDVNGGSSVVTQDYTITNGSVPTGSDISYASGIITLPSDFLKLVRVKVTGWHKAVMNPIEEDSEAYLMVHDDTAKPTIERPQVAIIQTSPQKLELFPTPGTTDTTIELTVVKNPIGGSTTGEETSTAFAVPPRVKGAFIYYLAFLVLSAYGDSRAQTMLGIARMELGVQQQ